MTNNLLRKQEHWVIVAVLAFAPASFAQNTTNMTLTGAGNYTVAGDVYVDPYTATVGTQTNVTVICDDWSNNSYLGESWTANVTNATAAGTTTPAPMFGNNQALYNEAAWLGSQILANYSANPTSAQQAIETELSFALWQLTYGIGSNTEDPAPLTYLGGVSTNQNQACGTEYQCAVSDYQAALGEANYNAAGWEILTPAGVGSPEGTTPQEFLVYTPESSTLILFGADLLGLLALAFLFRKRLLVPIG